MAEENITLKEDCKKLKQEKASNQRYMNTSDKIIAAIVKDKFINDKSWSSNVRSALNRQGTDADDETIRSRCKRGWKLINLEK